MFLEIGQRLFEDPRAHVSKTFHEYLEISKVCCFTVQKSHVKCKQCVYKSVNYDRPGEYSPEKDSL